MEITLGIAASGHECDTCPARNYVHVLFKNVPRTIIYTLTIGAGYRQPSYLCPDCLAKLRGVLGVEIDRKPKCACHAARFCYDLGASGCALTQ